MHGVWLCAMATNMTRFLSKVRCIFTDLAVLYRSWKSRSDNGMVFDREILAQPSRNLKSVVIFQISRGQFAYCNPTEIKVGRI